MEGYLFSLCSTFLHRSLQITLLPAPERLDKVLGPLETLLVESIGRQIDKRRGVADDNHDSRARIVCWSSS